MHNIHSQEIARFKLIILYTIKESPTPIDNIKLTELLIDKFDMNYFFIQEYLIELLENQYVEELNDDNNIKYLITDKGTQVLDYLKDILGDKEKNILLNLFNNSRNPKQQKEDVIADYYLKESGEYNVNLKLIEKDEILFSLYVSVPTENQAKLLCKKWKQNPVFYHKSILDLFI
jgi:predicted transcriptional regulator